MLLRKYFIFILLFCNIFFISYATAGAGLIPGPPIINANSYLLMDFNSGQILVAENIEDKLAPASLTKIMTVYVAASELVSNNLSMEENVVVSEKAWRMPGSRMFIEVNKKVSVGDLLKGVIIQSGNDASVALAEYISGSEEVFAQLMNQYASKLNLKNTHFVNSTGLPDQNHYTTAIDLAHLAAALIRHYPDIYQLHSVKEFTFNKITQRNRNNLLWKDESADGIKTGHTEEAGYCLVSSAVRNGMRLISVVMGTEGPNAREAASQALLNYGFRFYDTRQLYSKGQEITSAKIWKGKSENIRLGTSEDVFITFPRNQFENLDVVFNFPEIIRAPVSKGEQLGSFQVKISDKESYDGRLVAIEDVPESGLIKRLKDDIQLFFH